MMRFATIALLFVAAVLVFGNVGIVRHITRALIQKSIQRSEDGKEFDLAIARSRLHEMCSVHG